MVRLREVRPHAASIYTTLTWPSVLSLSPWAFAMGGLTGLESGAAPQVQLDSPGMSSS
jgi:hypothetical protein